MLGHLRRRLIKIRSQTGVLARLKSVLNIPLSLLGLATCHSARILFTLNELFHDLGHLLVIISFDFLN